MTKLDKMYHTRKYIKEYMPIIKDVFKEYYGSIWNEKIDKSLDNFSFVGYLSANDMNNIINNIKCDISKELEIKYLNTFGFNVNNRHLFFFSPGFSKLKHSYIYKIMHRQKGYEKLLRFVFDLKEDDENYSQKFNDYLRKIDASKETLYKYKKIYDKKLKEYEEYIDIDERYQELRNNGKAKYIQNLIERIYEYLPEEDKKFYIKNKKHFLNDKSAADYFRKMKIFKVIIRTYDDSIDFSYPGYIDAFTEEKEKKLNDPITAEYTRNNIKRDRVDYYKKMGLDLGDNYDNYINNPEAKKITPSKEMVQDLIHARKKENELLIKDFYLTIDMYKENKEILENKDFLVKHGSSFIYKSYNEKCWCVNFNIKITDDMVDGVTTVHPISDTVTLHPILLFNSNVKPYYFDYNLIHELNHILEYKIVDYIITKTGKNNNIDIYVESGFDFIFDGYLVPKLDKRKYEVFNEVINDLFSVDITNLMHSKGIYLFTEKKDKDCNKYGFSVYEYGKPLLRDFFNFYKEELKYARLTGIKTELFNTIGEDNFNELNDLINEFYIYFDCIHGESQKIEKTLDNINAGIETKDTRKYNDFIEMSQVILEQMKDYKNVYKRKLAA